MDVSFLIRHRLKELGLEQKDLAAAAQVTESYISQLLARKKAPPSPGRTDIYEKIGRALELPSGELSKLADLEREEELRKRVGEPARPLFKECRELILRKCDSARQKEVRRIFEKEPFGELERLVTQKLLDVTQGVAKEELQREEWLRLMARLSNRSYEQVRVSILEFLDTDLFNLSVENCISFLDPIVDSWSIDLKSFGMEVVLNRRLGAGTRKRFEFAEKEPQQPCHRTRAGTIPEGCVVVWQCNRRGNRIFEGSDVRRKATFPNLLLPGATKPEGSTSFPVRSTAWRIRLIEAFWGRQVEVLQLRVIPSTCPLRIMCTASSASSAGLRLLEGFCECEYSITLATPASIMDLTASGIC